MAKRRGVSFACRLLDRQHRRLAAERDQHVGPSLHQFVRQLGQAIVASVGPA
jgi:hypothetical protein